MKAKQLGLFYLLLSSISIFAQEENEFYLTPDTLKINHKHSPRIQRLIADPLTPSKAAFYSAIIPGLGQAYLGKAWKVPIIYAAIGASIYYFDINNKEMNSYRKAYKRRLNGFFSHTDDRPWAGEGIFFSLLRLAPKQPQDVVKNKN